jgi:hypothetical protein
MRDHFSVHHFPWRRVKLSELEKGRRSPLSSNTEILTPAKVDRNRLRNGHCQDGPAGDRFNAYPRGDALSHAGSPPLRAPSVHKGSAWVAAQKLDVVSETACQHAVCILAKLVLRVWRVETFDFPLQRCAFRFRSRQDSISLTSEAHRETSSVRQPKTSGSYNVNVLLRPPASRSQKSMRGPEPILLRGFQRAYGGRVAGPN